ncbi:hypothetical protein [Cellulophaga baltica]|uniref:DUF5017 domain-containing protein n=1 Tax=Cellulophaga baltica TaxID=76594 RepID=A0A1G7F689_9FLAO|nr:hypothetical protein [Cellulophaga baltica]SDE71105.1 hypothetical protein SAMN04487992_10335 [Cellulophaga baltica]
MKKIIYLLTIVAVGLVSSCNPVDDIYDDLEALEKNPLIQVGDVVLELSDDDYNAIGKTYGNFNSTDEAKDLISDLLKTKYPNLDVSSSALVTYNVYAPKSSHKKLYRYTVTTEDYDANDDTAEFDNFDDIAQVYAFIDTKYPTPADRDLVSLTYKYYSGTLNTLNNGFFFIDGAWEMIQGFTDAEYTLMGEGFPNFSSSDEAAVKIPIYLKDKFKYEPKEAGDIVSIMYKLYTTDVDDVDGDGRVDDNTTVSLIGYFIYDGAEFSKYNNEIMETLQFGFDGTNWIPDNTIKYTLGRDDYTLIGDALLATYAGPAGSAARYGNFDRRAGNAAEWTYAMLVEGMGILLNSIAPNADEGQKYIMTFDIYNGSAGTESISVIKTGGVWVAN